ncbi:MAG: sterol desaturase family protein [Panacagrimonas sp.]
MDHPPALADLLRPLIFFGLLALIGTLERVRPFRLSDPQRPLRWPANFGLVALGTLLLIALQLSAVAASVWAERNAFGLFNQVDAPPWCEAILAWLLLDLAIYAQHRGFHEIRWLWPLHRVHHSDVEFDVTTGLRFHPAELLASLLFKIGVIALLGAPWLAVLLFEIGLSSFALFTHANLRLDPRAEPWVRAVFVTPGMHRIHHSTHRLEMDSNYGNLLSVWDRLLRSYTRACRENPREMRIGLAQFRVSSAQSLPALLSQPFER